MGDELPSWGIKKLNKKGKILLILCVGIFFSVYFLKNSLVIIYAKNGQSPILDREEQQLILAKTRTFRFDPMEKVKDSVNQIALNQEKEREEKAKREDQKNQPKSSHERKYQELIAGSPLEKMLPFIAQRDNETASFLIAIAKKESDWGKYSPKKAGRDCFNYWGYRGTYNQTDSGYSCFDSPEQAIAVVGERIRELLDKKIDTAEKMVVWKCGSTCAGHDPAGVRKWISDVALYYGKANFKS
jgi:hypothetical protein